MQAIILAGGFGTRLKSLVDNIPKPMADINGKPFLEYLLNYLNKQNINNIIFSVGYKNEIIKDYFKNYFNGINISYSTEKNPLGTGGAIKKALEFVKNDDCFIINGDTFFEANLDDLYQLHKSKNADVILSLKQMKNFDRYGTVKINENNKIICFEEKKYQESGFINGGVCIIKKNLFEKFNLEEKFSFESDFIEKYYKNLNIYGILFDKYFIDIGIPEDYERSKKEFAEFEY